MNVNNKVSGKNFCSFSSVDMVRTPVIRRTSHYKMPKRLTLNSVARPNKIFADLMWFWPCIVDNVAIKCQLDVTDDFLLQILLLAQHVSGTIMPIIRSSRVLYKWLSPVVFGAVKMEICNRFWCYKCGNTLAQLTKPASNHNIPPHNKSGIYSLTCKTCNLSYVGQTSRTWRPAFKSISGRPTLKLTIHSRPTPSIFCAIDMNMAQ
jgi:hypothetical protein